MTLFRKTSYRTEFSFLIIGFILALSASSFLYLRWLQDNFIESALYSQGQVISEMIAEDMAQLVFLADPDLLASITFKLKGIKELRSAVFYDKNNKILLKITGLNDYEEGDETLKVKTDIRYDAMLVGYALLNLHSHVLHEEKNIRMNCIFYF